MALKAAKGKKQMTVTKTEKATTRGASNGDGTGVGLAHPTVGRADKGHRPIYDDAVKEIANLAQNESAARKVDNGALKESRGKDTWNLHAQLRALDQSTARFEELLGEVQNSVATLDQHRHADSTATTALVESHGANVSSRLTANREAIQGWITSTRSELNKTVKECETALLEAVSKAQSSVNRNVKESNTDLAGKLDGLHQTVKDSFAKLAKATAGSEENLRSQTDSFSKATENLLNNLQSHMDRRIQEFRDESTRQVDKRFNQSDVAFAAVRADQEVIKALLTDIIKDRLGRSEPRMK